MNEFLQSLRNNKNKPYNRSRRQYDGNQYNPQDKRSGNDRRQRPHRQYTDYDKRGGSQDDDLKALKPLLESLVANQQKRVAIDERRAAAEERKAEALEGIVVYLKHLVGPDAPDFERMVLPDEVKNEIDGPMETMEEPFEAAEEEMIQAQATEEVEEPAFYAPKEEFAPVEPEHGPEDDSMTVEEYLMMTAGGGKMEEEELPEDAPAKTEKLVLEAEPVKTPESKTAAAAEEMEATDPDEDDVERVDIMGVIREMRGEGKTYGQIAQYLADRNLPTFSGRGKWHAQTVHRLCQKR